MERFLCFLESFSFEAVMREGGRDVVVFVERRRPVVRVPEVGLVLS